jgi:hypothetical protein
MNMERKIIIKDDLHPEDNAMLQALYSRSPASVEDHLPKVEAAGSGKFMDDYYVGYGHASIGDCGTTTLFIEGVSMLMAKAIQDNPLYSGQEASTRYMDFSDARFESPGNTDLEGHLIQRDWMVFYHRALPEMIEHLRKLHPQEPGEERKKYEKALKARAFDVLRAFIPAGMHTNLSWHTNLRQARDKLRSLVAHPEPSTSSLAYELLGALHQKYPHSGFDYKMSAEEWEWRKQVMASYAYSEEPPPTTLNGVHVSLSSFQWPHDRKMMQLLAKRPQRVVMPGILQKYGVIASSFSLDFGSFRDLQRHRNGFVQMPLLTVSLGIHPWYYEQMPEHLRTEAQELVARQIDRIKKLNITDVERQSYIAMGFQVPCKVVQSLPAWAYRVELRTSQSVHPTLRRIAQLEGRVFRDLTSGEIPLHLDLSPDTWDTRRGSQTIEELSPR